MIAGGIVAVTLSIVSLAMPFTTTDRDNVRDLFGYPWSLNDLITSLLDAAYDEHGDDVVTAVQGYLVDAQGVEAGIDTATSLTGYTEVEIEGEVRVRAEAGGSLSMQNNDLEDLKNKIRLAIDPSNQLYQRGFTVLLRS